MFAILMEMLCKRSVSNQLINLAGDYLSHLSPVLTVTVLALTLILSLALCGRDEAIQLATEEVPLFF